jgi:anti-sigma factor RsiW
MSETGTEGRDALYAYHDGELRGLARWRFERRLRREPALRRELETLARLAVLVRESEGEATGPDLWDRIAQRLPAGDARRTEAEVQRPSRWMGWAGAGDWLRPAGAVAAAAALLVAVYAGIFDAAAPQTVSVVRWMDSGGRPVMLLEEGGESEVTIIWVLEDAVEGAAHGGGGGVA